jgi:hypothetical protein
MKKPVLLAACVIAAALLAGWTLAEQRACARLAAQNDAFRRQLAGSAGISAKAHRPYSGTSAPAPSAGPQSATPEAAPTAMDAPNAAPETEEQEIARLHRELDSLQQQHNEIQNIRADTRQLRAARRNILNSASPGASPSASASDLEIVSASYWTDTTNLDVAEELRDRIRQDSLKAVASNNLKGDPDFGKVKTLTIVYRLGGVIITNDFRENDIVMIPPSEALPPQ